MPIQGAIFDCDGTILDSMPMWTQQCVALLERYGVENAERVFAEHESLDMDKKCYWYHDNLHIGTSGEALYKELWDAVSGAYCDSVRPYEGCREFLCELKRRKIPCVIVSSTPKELLRSALADHDLLDFFRELVFVGDVGRGKEFSDCYVAAERMLETPRESTWVFEDAPFGVRSAARAGFPTVAIVNDHDGRDESFMMKWATVVARSYGELSIPLLDQHGPRVTRSLVVAGSPEPSSSSLVARLAGEADFIVAADKGVDALRGAGVVPHAYCGDQDSASPEALAWARAEGAGFQVHNVEKDDTDLSLAIEMACDEADRLGSALRLTLTCASGGRPDHMLGVWGTIARRADICPTLVEDGFTCKVLSPLGEDTWCFDGLSGRTVSAIPLAPHSIVTESGMHWDVDRAELRLMDDLGVSNKIKADKAYITCHAGVLAVFVLEEDCDAGMAFTCAY